MKYKITFADGTTKIIEAPNCPECGTEMGKAGSGWSGRTNKQNWRCNNCGRNVLKWLYPVTTLKD